MAYALDVLNKIRSDASEEYQNRIPQATRDNLASIGQAFKTYTALYNEFCSALINRIGLTLLETAMFNNPLKSMKAGTIDNMQDIQDIYVSMAKAEGMYDPDGKNPLGRRTPAEVEACFHRLNRQDKYVISIGDLDFKRSFSSVASLEAFISAQLQSIYTADEYDEWLAMKNVFATYAYEGKSYFNYEVPAITGTNNAEAAKQFIKTVKKCCNDISFMSDKYNAAGVMRKTDPNKGLTTLLHKDIMPEIEVEVLMSAFNADKAAIKPTIIVMDDFGSLTTDDAGQTYALLFENDFSRMYDTLFHAEPIRNPDGLFTNTFLHHHQILSLCPFKNAIRFVGK